MDLRGLRYLPFLAALAIVPHPVRADAAPPPETKVAVAVMDFKAANTSANDAVAISGFVRSAVVRSNQFLVVEKNNMDKVLTEQAFQQTGCTSSECAVKLGKLLNVRKMVVGEYTVLGDQRFLTASLVDVESGAIERSAAVKGFTIANVDDAANRLAAQLTGRLTAGAEQMPGAPAPVPPVRQWRWGLGAGFLVAREGWAIPPTPTAFNRGHTESPQYFRGPVVEASVRFPLGERSIFGLGFDGHYAGLRMSGGGAPPSANTSTGISLYGVGAIVWYGISRWANLFVGGGVESTAFTTAQPAGPFIIKAKGGATIRGGLETQFGRHWGAEFEAKVTPVGQENIPDNEIDLRPGGHRILLLLRGVY